MSGARVPLPMDGPTASEPLAPIPDAAPLGEPLTADEIRDMHEKIVQVLCTVFDPEIPVNIYELGLIYDVEIAPTGAVLVRMSLTTPMCPAAGSLPGEVERKTRSVPKVTSAKVDLVWDPPWDKDRMSEAAKLQLGIEDF
jgi:FeS assembly SUF system protein